MARWAKSWAVVALVLFGAVGICLADDAGSTENGNADAVKVARQYLDDLRAGKFEACVAASDDKMREVLPAPKLEAVWGKVSAAFGMYESESSVDVAPGDGVQMVDLNCKFSQGSLRVRISVDKAGRVSGLFFTPIADEVKYDAPKYVDPTKFREEKIELAVDGLTLPGTLTLPVGDGPFPGVVLVHGSGPNDQDETIHQTKPFKDLAWGLASRGIAVLRYDKRTFRYGDRMNPADVTLDTEVANDAIGAVKLLAGRSEVRDDRVFVVGHSLGATAGPYIGLHDPSIAGLVLLCPAARPLYELVLDQVTYIANMDGKVDDDERKGLEEIQSVVDKLRKGDFKPDETLLSMPAKYWVDLDRMEPLENGKKYDKPMLVVFGARDYQITSRESDPWKQALEGKSNATIKIFDNYDHLLHAGEGMSTPEDYGKPEHVDESAIVFVADWVKQQSK